MNMNPRYVLDTNVLRREIEGDELIDWEVWRDIPDSVRVHLPEVALEEMYDLLYRDDRAVERCNWDLIESRFENVLDSDCPILPGLKPFLDREGLIDEGYSENVLELGKEVLWQALMHPGGFPDSLRKEANNRLETRKDEWEEYFESVEEQTTLRNISEPVEIVRMMADEFVRSNDFNDEELSRLYPGMKMMARYLAIYDESGGGYSPESNRNDGVDIGIFLYTAGPCVIVTNDFSGTADDAGIPEAAVSVDEFSELVRRDELASHFEKFVECIRNAAELFE